MLKKLPLFAFLPFALCLLTIKTAAQRTFRAGIVAGFTAAQLDGDNVAGFHKPGLQGGGRVSVRLKEKHGATIQLLFTQRGSKQVDKPDLGIYGFKITTNYVDIPLEWHYNDWLVEDGDGNAYYKVSFDAGAYYGRLLNWKASCSIEPCDYFTDRLKAANQSDFGWLVGATLMGTRHLGFSFRYARSFGYLFNPEKQSDPQLQAQMFLKSYFLNFQTAYLF